MQKSHLHDVTQASGALTGEWQGWELPLSYGNPEEEYSSATTSAAVYDASAIGRLKVTGADGLDLLHRLSTNAVESLIPGQGTNTVLTDDRGRIIDLITVTNLGEYVLILTSPNQQQRIIDWLDKYTIVEDITVEDVTGDTAMLGLVGPNATNVAAKTTGAAAVELQPCCAIPIDDSGCLLRCDMGSLPNFYVVGGAEAVQRLWGASVEAGAKPMGLEAYQSLRVELGVPAHGSELGDAYNPLEAGLLGAISFTKGCYIGQEVIARLDTYQKLQRRLVSLNLPGPSESGTRLMLDNREVGVVTSVSPLSLKGATNGQRLGLGYVRTAAAEEGARLELGDTGEAASIQALLEPLG